MSEVLSPTTPPTEATTETTTAETFTRVDEEATAAPIVIKVTGEFAEDFKREDNLFIADPCMADHGKMYHGRTGNDHLRDSAAMLGKVNSITTL